MNSLQQRIFVERIENENKHLKIHDKFVLAGQKEFLTSKFYARHDAVSKSDVKQEYIDYLTRRFTLPPTKIYKYQPPCVNMDYGWFSEPLIPRSNDPRIHFPRRQAKFIEFELNLRIQERILPVKKFTGVPFHLK